MAIVLATRHPHWLRCNQQVLKFKQVLKMKKIGFTLTEVLVAVVLTLILLGLMIRAFAITGAEVTKGRALLEMAGQLRTTSDLLRKDLSRLTVSTRTFNRTGSASGYFEYIEGLSNDSFAHTFQNGNADPSGTFGDVDDILMFTARSLDKPFRGRFGGVIIESNYAEIIWWTAFEDENGDGQYNVDERLKLYRRVLLIRPDLLVTGTTVPELNEFLQHNDISVRFDPVSAQVYANSLTDLANRANRFARAGRPFPHEPDYAIFQGTNQFVLSNPTPAPFGTTNLNQGEDILLTSLAAFDVQAFDPAVGLQQSPDAVVGLSPSDPGYNRIFNDDLDPLATGMIAFGGYVDLGSGIPDGGTSADGRNNYYGIFPAWPNFPAPDDNSIVWTNATFCTWSSHYERDGLDNDNDGLIDEGSNNIDEDGTGGTDDVQEYETAPPYAHPLRGLKITIRLVEPTTQLIRQTTVISNFVPE